MIERIIKQVLFEFYPQFDSTLQNLCLFLLPEVFCALLASVICRRPALAGFCALSTVLDLTQPVMLLQHRQVALHSTDSMSCALLCWRRLSPGGDPAAAHS